MSAFCILHQFTIIEVVPSYCGVTFKALDSPPISWVISAICPFLLFFSFCVMRFNILMLLLAAIWVCSPLCSTWPSCAPLCCGWSVHTDLVSTITITIEHGVESQWAKNRRYANVSHRHRILNSVDRLFWILIIMAAISTFFCLTVFAICCIAGHKALCKDP